MTRTTRLAAPRPLAVLAAAVLAVSGVALAAAADAQESTTVATETSDPSRELRLLDLAGNDLDRLELRDGVPRGFEVRVIDHDQTADNEFQVSSTLNNLHRRDGDGALVAGDLIPSGNVQLGYATNPVGALGMEVGADLDGVLDSAAPISCDDVASLLSLGSLLQDDPLCTLISDLLNLDVLNLGSGDTVEFSGVALPLPVDAIAIDDLPLADLPLVPSEGDQGPYTNPECGTGIAADLCDGTSPTALDTLRGTSNTALAAEIERRLTDAVAGGDLVGPDGPLAVSDVLSALRDSTASLRDSGGSAVGSVGELADAISAYDAADQVTVINGLLDASVGSVGLGDLARLAGTHRSFPTLTVDTGGAAGGSYEGTLTVTLIE